MFYFKFNKNNYCKTIDFLYLPKQTFEMTIQILEPRRALNKAFLKIKPNRTGIELFKSNLITILDSINEKESEEFHKNLVIEFLKKTYYDSNHFINTKGRNDLVIHNGKDAKTNVGVIIEVKSPSNRSEMISIDNINGKAFHELVLYYMRERITQKNTELKHVIISNIYQWFVFDAQLFNKLFAENKTFVKQFIDFEEKRLSGSKTEYFYNDIVKPYIEDLQGEIQFAHFDIRSYEKPLRNTDKNDDKALIALFKLLSPEHILKLSFANDSNSLDKNFYNELLHIIGLTEVKDGGKKLIKRLEKEDRNDGSILENAILQLDSEDKLNYIPNLKQYGESKEEQLFAIGLELTITWINRILFLKLLEAQLISYHRGDKNYSFLNTHLIKDYDVLNNLFFKVLAKKPEERIGRLVKDFEKIPYLNSSLFESTPLERISLSINQLEDNISLPLLPNTVLKDSSGKKLTGSLNALDYFFSFLDAYDFASEGSEEIQEDNKTLINASVLGLIFEKINGYKDGSFFTPSFITMYMCRETIRRAVLQKFNETLHWSCNDFSELYNQIKDKKEANRIVNSIKICDPAVGSGHFLVSALNEIIAIKHDLGILIDKTGKTLRDYDIEVVNDELIITHENSIPFQYNISNKESQRVQETLFHEKQTIIENCLFGVDLNPNSVKICRLRLWIELLKNAYYKQDSDELETLPNIDINIKCGNSLISRFRLDSDLKQTLKKSRLTIQSYKDAVRTYQNAESKEQKKEMEDLIASIKSNFRTEISGNSKEIRELQKITIEYNNKYVTEQLFDVQLTKAQIKDKKQLEEKIKNQQAVIEDIKTNKIYENAFEWRFEFPEVLNDEGDFIGFDTIIGNPPYIQLQKMGADGASLEKMKFETYVRTGDIYSLFYELGFKLLKKNGLLAYITSNKWMRAAYGESLRKYFVEKTNPFLLLDFGGIQVFDSATVDTNILIGSKAKYDGNTNACLLNNDFDPELLESFIKNNSTSTNFKSESWVVLSSVEKRIKEKIEKIGTPLKDWDIKIYRGVLTGYNEAFIIDGAKREELIKEDPKSVEIIRPILRGRDIKKYSYDYADIYLITTFPSLKINIDNYPSVKQHLLSFGYDRLKQTGDVGARKKSNNNWFETQDSIGYWEDFSKQKIMYPNMTKFLPFYLDNEKFIQNDKAFMITGNKLAYLTAFLNSSLFKYCFIDNFPELQGGTRELRKIFLDKIPVLQVSEEVNLEFQKLVFELQSLHMKKMPTKDLEIEIDRKIFDLYSLTSEERKDIGYIEIV